MEQGWPNECGKWDIVVDLVQSTPNNLSPSSYDQIKYLCTRTFVRDMTKDIPSFCTPIIVYILFICRFVLNVSYN